MASKKGKIGIYLEKPTIKLLKIAGIEKGISASDICSQAIVAWLRDNYKITKG